MGTWKCNHILIPSPCKFKPRISKDFPQQKQGKRLHTMSPLRFMVKSFSTCGAETTIFKSFTPSSFDQMKRKDLKFVASNKATITAARDDEAFNWLRENGHGDLIKKQVSLEFGMKQDNEAKSIIEELKAKGLPVKQKTTVHPSSLRGFVREQIQDLGKDVPAELFGTYVAKKTKITTKE